MRFNPTITLTVCLSLSALAAFAQGPNMRRANKQYEHLAFAEAIENYEAAALKNDSLTVAESLGTCYFEIRNMSKAQEWFAIATEQEEANASVFYYYAEALKANGKYDEAMVAMSQYQKLNSADQRAKNMLENPNYVEDLNAKPKRYTLTNMDCNTNASDFGPSLLGDTLYFVSSRKSGVGVKRTFSWNNSPFLDLYQAEVAAATTGNIRSAGTEVNSTMHEGPACFTPDGETMYFTRNNRLNGKTKKTSDDLVNLKIFRAKKGALGWTNVQEFEWNSEEYSVGHPSISKDGKTLYFASDMPGGQGATDLYFCELNDDGTWTTPKNLGSTINTEGNEMFPFIDDKGVLYFSSDGHLGLGGLDVFKARIKNNSAPQNLGAPLNSSMDDFSLVLGEDQLHGYLSSNRSGGKGDDDIYAFTINELPSLKMDGLVVDESTGLPLANARVSLKDKNGKVLQTVNSGDLGEFVFDLEPGECGYTVFVEHGETWKTFNSEASSCDVAEGTINLGQCPLEPLAWTALGTIREKGSNTPLEGFMVSLTNDKTGEVLSAETAGDGKVNFPLEAETDYSIRFEKEGFFAKNGRFSTVNMKPGVVEINKYIDLEFEAIELGKGIKIENIYYDYNKSFIRADAAVELDKIVKLLIENPTIKIEMGSHTDARGSDSYNMKLSDRRAKAAMDYLIKNGIAKSRVTFKGYGETSLINKCENGVTCEDELHEENRRTEFKVIGFVGG